MASRANAAAKNAETRIVPYLDIEKYTKASPEFKEAARALNSVRNGGCKCGNPHPQEFYAACGEHLACEACHDDYSKVATRTKGLCNYPGCHAPVMFPAPCIKAYAIKQQQVAEAIHKLDVALQKEEVKDSQGSHLRDVAMGRAAPASAEEEAGPAGQRGSKRRTRADYTEEEWEEKQGKKAAAAERKRERTEVARKAAAYDELLQQHKKLLDLLERNEISISDLKCPADPDFSECSECSECSDCESDDDEPLAKRAARMC
jgi:hypothetical protein